MQVGGSRFRYAISDKGAPLAPSCVPVLVRFILRVRHPLVNRYQWGARRHVRVSSAGL